MSKAVRTTGVGLWLVLLACMVVAPAGAATRAWLDRNRVELGQPVTLNVETDEPGAVPDWSPLRADFEFGNQTSSRQTTLSNGQRRNSALYALVLVPRRNGRLELPSLRVGSERSAPLVLEVSAGTPADAHDAVAFVETEVDDLQPYVQQNVGVVVRLYFATQLASGELVLDTPDGAALQRIGEDSSSQREVRGRRYNVVERRFLLIPERSGALTVPGARFSGRGVGGLLDEFIGRGNGRLSATAAPVPLHVRPMPTPAPQPWLPLKGLRLRYLDAPRQARAGEAFVVQVEAVADGAVQAQFPALPVPSLGDAAQVFAEPAQAEESFRGNRPQLRVVRSYSIVPQQGGRLQVPGISLPWWDVDSGHLRQASLPALEVEVSGGNARLAPPPPASVDATAVAMSPDTLSGAQPPRPWGWIAAAAGFALLWVLTLAWAWRVRRQRGAPSAQAPLPRSPGAPRPGRAQLRQAIDHGGLDEVASVLCAMAQVDSLDAVIAALDDPAQRTALQAMQRARWGGQGDPASARAQLRQAFADGPRWRASAPVTHQATLPPLYPPH